MERRAGQIERTLDALRHDLEAERQARTTADTETNRRIAAVTVEGLHWEIIGLWWLAIATVASTWPEWIAKLL